MCTTKKLLAFESHFGCVTHCDCGTLHLTIGVVSLALDQEALRRIHQLVGAALKQLPERPDENTQVTQEGLRAVHVH